MIEKENSSVMDAVVTLEDPKIMNDEVFTISSHINCTYTIEVTPHVESVITLQREPCGSSAGVKHELTKPPLC